MQSHGHVAAAIVTAAVSGALAMTTVPAHASVSSSSAGSTWSAIPTAARAPIQAALAKANATDPPEPKETANLTATDAANSSDLGYSVAISGNTIAVGTPFHQINGSIEGGVYVFTKPAAGWADASKPATLTVGGGMDQGVGRSVGISGNTIVAGGDGGSNEGGLGGVWVWTEPPGGWKTDSTPTSFLQLSPAAGEDNEDGLGFSVGISGDTVVAGANLWTKNVVPPPTASNTGVVAVYTKPLTGWPATMNQTAVLEPTDPTDQAHFGNAVAIDGSTVVVGAQGANATYVFTKPDAGWSSGFDHPQRQVARLSQTGASNFGFSVGVSGRTVAVGAPGTGEGYVFAEPPGGWADATAASATLSSTMYAALGGGGGAIGTSIGVFGSSVVVGGPDTFGEDPKVLGVSGGTVSLFTEPAGGWSGTLPETATLIAGHPTGDLGEAVAIEDGVVVGGATEDPNHGAGSAGAAFVYAAKTAPPKAPKPTLTRLAQSPKTWKLGSKLPALNPKKAVKGGTKYSFTLNEKAATKLTFALVKGKKKTTKATLSVKGIKGANHLYFDGRITKSKRLAPGKYLVTFVATTSAGHTTAKSLSFTIK